MSLSYRRILIIAFPIIAANAVIPMQGLVDTAIAGRFALVERLTAVGLMAEFWGFAVGSLNFLQYATSGQTAQLLGQRAFSDIQQTLLRALLLAVAMGSALLLFQNPLFALAQFIFHPDGTVTQEMSHYFHVRVWGIAAELSNYALIGWFAGQSLSKQLLIHQLVLTSINIFTTLFFTQVCSLGIAGLALGTVIGHFAAIIIGLLLAHRHLLSHSCNLFVIQTNTFKLTKLRKLFILNANLFIRALMMSICFTWLMRLSVQSGNAAAATMTIVLWLLTIASFSLDGVAVVTESLCGQAIGAKKRAQFDQVVRKTWQLNAYIAFGIAFFYWLIYPYFIRIMTPLPELQELANSIKGWIIFLPVVSVSSYVFDGVFFAATAGKSLRNGMLLTTLITLPGAWLTHHLFGITGVCIGFWLFFIARSTIFWLLLPRVTKQAFEGNH